MALQIEKPTNRELSLERSKLASQACERGAFDEAALLYGEAISLDPCNPVLYTNRSAVYLKTKQNELALEDGKKAAELKPNWQKAHYRQAVALQCMGKYQESLAAFASALAHDQKSQQLLSGIIDTAMKSPLKENIEKIFARLQQVNMDQNPFVVVSIIGQELLNAGHIQPAITCLENALKIGTVGLRMRGSVISALTSAYWKVGNLSRSVELMQEDLEISRSLADHDGECRVLGNLGNAYFTMKQHEEALNAHRTQLLVASKHKNKKGAASALSSIAHVYVSLGDYPNAIDSHNKAIDFQRKLNDPLGEALELGHLGAAHLLAGNVDKSIECHTQQLTLAKTLKNDKEIALAYGNLGSAYNQKGNFQEAAKLHGQVLKIAETLGDPALEARACAGLGGAYRATGNQNKALKYYERQQSVAVKLKDRIMEGRALSNLGIIYLEQGECLHALKLHKVHLAICQEFGDRAGQGQAYGNMGCAYCALKKYEQAIKYHEKELAISKEVNDTISEACTHGNLAVAYQGLGKSDEARKHYEQHLAISRSNRDTYNEGVALFNLGNFYSSSGSFKKAIAFYEKYLSLTQSTGDKKGENKACHNLAFARFSLGHLEESVKLYKQNIELAQSIGDKNTLARAYCNLGLVYKDLGDFQNSLMCQTNFQTVSHEIGYSVGECRALGNIGDIYVKTKRTREAVGCYERQLKIAEKLKDRGSLCQAYAALGHAYKVLGKVDKALVCHSKELAFRREFDDMQGLFKALDHIGTDCTASGRTDEAIEYFSEQRLIADRVKDPLLQARAYGNLGLAKLNAGAYGEAMTNFGNQIETLERVAASSIELGRAQGNLAECSYMLGNHEQARELYECYLTSAKEAGTPNDQDKAYQGLGNTYRALGNLQQALFCFENRLVFAHELTETTAKGSAYGELGNLHRTMGNFEQAAACYGQQLTLAKECQDLESESDAECGLGEVYAKMGDYETALVHHENDLKLADKLHNSMRQSRAFGNLGLVYEFMREHKKASECQEQHLSIAAQVSDRVAKVNAYSSLGRNHYLIANFAQAISYFKQGLTIAETLGRSEDEATIRYWLGVALCAKKDILPSLEQLYQAIELYEKLRDVGVSTGRFQLAMHEQQTLCYQVLQRVLIDLGRREEALVIAERARAHDFINFLLRRPDAPRAQEKDWVRFESYDQIMDVVNKQNGYFLCYSLVLGYLCIWLIVPQHGIVKFHELRLTDEMPELMVNMEAGVSTTSESLLERLVGQVRENIGVEPACGSSVSTMSSSLSGSDLDEPPSPFDGSPSRCSSEAGSISSTPSNLSYIKNGFLKKGLRKLNGIRHDRNKNVTTALPVQVLYDTLIAPVEEFLPRSPQSDGSLHDLVLVLQGDLYLVPFSLLHGHSKDYLHKRFSLLTVPSIRALLLSPTTPQRSHTTRIVVGDPQLPLSFDQYRCTPSTQGEAELVGTLFGSKPLIGNDASKDVVCRKVQEAECVHFATNTSWKHSALVLSPNKEKNRNSGGSDSFMPSPTDFLLTASEISHMKFSAKMIVLSCAQNETRNKMSLDGLLCLVRSFLLAGCSCVLVSLWPVPEPAYRLLLQGFYKRFLRGMRASRALAHAVKLVESNKEFDHPSNWAGFVLVGRDVKVPKKTIQLREALIVVIESTANCREALKVILHLVDKANQRLLNNNTSLMYTAEASIETKLGETQGWRDVLTAAGFRFRKAAKKLPDAVFFPLKDEKGKLRQCGDILRSLLGLSPTTLQAISKVLSAPTLVRALLDLFNLVLSSFAKGLNNVQVPLPLNLWHMVGCHELLASMAFDLLGVGKDEVMLRSGGVNSRRVLQCAVVALNTLTGGLGTDNIQFNGEFPLRRTGSDSSLKSSVSTISSFSYASAERTIQARSYNGSSRRSHVSDVESILDDLEKCQEESSVDPDVTDGYPNSSDDIPINSESRALSLDRKRNTRTNTSQAVNSPKLTQVNISQNIKSPNYSETDGLTNSSLFTNNNTLAPPEVTSLSPLSSSGRSVVSSPVRMNGHVNGHRENHATMAKSPVIDRTSFPFPSHFRDTSDSLDSESSTSVSSPGHKTPGSINLMQHHANGVGRNRGDKVGNVRNTGDQNGVDKSPQMRRGNLRRGFNAVEHEVDVSHDIDKSHDHTHDKGALRHENHVNENHVTSRARSVSFDSIIDSDDTTDPKDRRSDDVATFHALIQNTRGTRRTLYTRGNKSNVNKRFSKSEETLQYVGKDHEPRELFSMELDADSVISSDRPRDSDVTSGVSSSSSSYLEARLQNGGETNTQTIHMRRKLKSGHLANLKNLQASAC